MRKMMEMRRKQAGTQHAEAMERMRNLRHGQEAGERRERARLEAREREERAQLEAREREERELRRPEGPQGPDRELRQVLEHITRKLEQLDRRMQELESRR